MNNGWIKLHRRLLENPAINRPAYISLWVILLLKANHKVHKFMWNNDVIYIKEGQLLTGRKELSALSGIPESTIEDILKSLESQQQIRQEKTTKYRVITILNWDKYQGSDKESDNKATTKQQQTDTNKNEKNKKNIAARKNSRPPFKKYNENEHYEDLPSVDADSMEEIVDEPQENITKQYDEMIQWLENQTGVKIISRPKQKAALLKARTNKISRQRLKDRFFEVREEDYFKKEGKTPTWANVVSSFEHKS